jgi:alpha-L-rhamnosidase
LIVATDEAWCSTPSHILGVDIIAGEIHDFRQRVSRWSEGEAAGPSWDPVRLAQHDFARLSAPLGPPCRRIEEVHPVSIRELAPQRHVVDFGQNINGWVRLAGLGPAGSKLTLVYGEALDAAGDVTQHNVSHAERFPERHFQTDVVISAGDETVFEPRHSTKGFRYIRLENHAGKLLPESISAIVVHSELTRAGDFTCSDERLNRLHSAIDWSFRGNACSIPTDCPTRERAGWSGDYQTFIETAAYLYDVKDFSLRWLNDMAAEQWPDGTILNCVPDPHDFSLEENAMWRGAQGSAGWGDAACHVPWELYRSTGQAEVLAPLIPMMRAWVDFALKRAAGGRHNSRATARPEPLPHEQFLWDTGFHFGEWAEPDRPKDPAAAFARVLSMDHGPTATAFLHRSASECAKLIALTGAVDTAYSDVAKLVRDAWCAEFLDSNGRVQPQTQANLVRALAFHLLPADCRQRAADDLAALVRASGNHLGTGFLATPYLLPVLADHGYLDLAYELLFQNTPPSWLHMIDQGATTMWEIWTKFDGKGEGSLNHYSKGSVATFLHTYVAGLQIVEPGYRRFRVAPRPGGGLSSANTWHESPFGRIAVAWRAEDSLFMLDVLVPDGTTADVKLPDGSQDCLRPGRHTLSCRACS